MTLHPFIYCSHCEAVQPFFYDFINQVWCCFICGHAAKSPEHDIPEPGKIRNEK